MSKDKNKSLIKSARKATRKELNVNISSNLKEVVNNLGHDSKKITKEINKASKQLSKKLAEIIRIDKSVINEIKKKEEPVQAEKSNSDFSTPQPLPSQLEKQENTLSGIQNQSATKKPVITNNPANQKTAFRESTVSLAEKITESSTSESLQKN